MHRNKMFLIGIFFTSFLAGIVWVKFGALPQATFIAYGFLLSPVLLTKSPAKVFVVILIGLNLGLFRGAVTHQKILSYKQYFDQKLSISGAVIDDPVYSDKGQTEFYIKNVEIGGVSLPGKVRVRGFGASGVLRGDNITATGTLRDGFASWQASIYFAQIETNFRPDSSIESFRREFFARINSLIGSPESSLGIGFLFGAGTVLPDELTLQLRATGLMHIVAVSGYNLTVLVRISRRLLRKGSLYLSTVMSFALVSLFLLITGITPSLSRAAVVVTLALLAKFYGRRVNPLILILSSAAITVLFNPLYIWFDLGWYLSFLAFAGVLIIAPLATERFFRKPPKLVGQIMVETVSAQLLALPLIVLTFGEFSPISFVANLLILPLVPLAMALVFVAGLAPILLPGLAGWLALPAQYVLAAIVDIVELLSSLPWALVDVQIGILTLVFVYLAIATFAVVMYAKRGGVHINASDLVD